MMKKQLFRYSYIALIAFLLGWYCHIVYVRTVGYTISPPTSTSSPKLVQETPKPALRRGKTEYDSKEGLINVFHKLINQNDMDELISFFEEVKDKDDDDWIILRALYLRNLFKWNKNANYSLTLRTGIPYLDIFYNDTEVMSHIAQAYFELGQTEDAIKIYYSMKTHSTKLDQINQVENLIHKLVDQYHEVLFKQRLWQDILSFYEYLHTVEPDYPNYHLNQALVYIEIEQFSNAREELLSIVDDENLGLEAKRLLNSVDRYIAGLIRVPMERDGANFLVPAVLNNDHQLKLLLDTGASISALSSERFRSVKSENRTFIKNQQMVTANGSVNVPIYQIKQLQLQNQLINNVAFIVLDNFHGADGLLGMNVLELFKFDIDQEDPALLLSPR